MTFMLIALLFALPFQQDSADVDEQLCLSKFALPRENDAAIGQLMSTIGRSFMGTPYVAHTLEAPGDERLVVNLRGLDCVTFVENTLTIGRCVQSGKTTFDDYRGQLQLIRYRGGVIDGYPSRLHYFTDWIYDNEQKGIVRNVTSELGGVPFPKTINFMTTHRDAYRQLSDDGYFQMIASTEAELAKRKLTYIPKSQVAEVEPRIQDGDIIAITTSVDGLDIAHTGLAVRVDGELRFLHAPMSGSSVQITSGSLSEYLATIKKHTGIMVARPVEP